MRGNRIVAMQQSSCSEKKNRGKYARQEGEVSAGNAFESDGSQIQLQSIVDNRSHS